jgi:WD40 repeat protein
LERHSGYVSSVAFSPDGKRVMSGSYYKAVRIWDVASGAETGKLEGHSDGVISVAFSPDGKSVVSGSYDKAVRIWDVAFGAETGKLEGHSVYVRSVALSPDGKSVVSVLFDYILVFLYEEQRNGSLPASASASSQIEDGSLRKQSLLSSQRMKEWSL